MIICHLSANGHYIVGVLFPCLPSSSTLLRHGRQAFLGSLGSREISHVKFQPCRDDVCRDAAILNPIFSSLKRPLKNRGSVSYLGPYSHAKSGFYGTVKSVDKGTIAEKRASVEHFCSGRCLVLHAEMMILLTDGLFDQPL